MNEINYIIKSFILKNNQFILRNITDINKQDLLIKSNNLSINNKIEVFISNFGHAGDQNLHLNILIRYNLFQNELITDMNINEENELNRIHDLFNNLIYTEVIKMKG